MIKNVAFVTLLLALGLAGCKTVKSTDIYHFWANTVCMGGALLMFNAVDVVHAHLGGGKLLRLFAAPLPEKPDSTDAEN